MELDPNILLIVYRIKKLRKSHLPSAISCIIQISCSSSFISISNPLSSASSSSSPSPPISPYQPPSLTLNRSPCFASLYQRRSGHRLRRALGHQGHREGTGKGNNRNDLVEEATMVDVEVKVGDGVVDAVRKAWVPLDVKVTI